MFSKGKPSVSWSVFRNNIDDLNLLCKYCGIDKVPILMSSPFREDRNPSFALFYDKNGKIRFKDFSNGETGDVFDMLGKVWNMSYVDVMRTLIEDNEMAVMASQKRQTRQKGRNSDTVIEVKVRRWLKHDIEYWKGFGISIPFLKFAEVYPISHIFFIKEGKTDIVEAERYAYVYIERRDGVIYKKIYQPLSKNKRYKWLSKMNGSIMSLYDKIPDVGEKLVICSSLKDALCLWENTGIPCISPQGEGYSIDKNTIVELKDRFDEIFVLFDNDDAGKTDSEKLSLQTGFKNVTLPDFGYGKDVSDYYKGLQDKSEFKKTMYNLLNIKKETQ